MGKVIEDEHYYNNRYIVVNHIVEFERAYMVDENKFAILPGKSKSSISI
ncbi:hypothetical protein [uncultured Clostridium sp.]|nr:hypothetical protein [uncultured Clostridium sp.]